MKIDNVKNVFENCNNLLCEYYDNIDVKEVKEYKLLLNHMWLNLVEKLFYNMTLFIEEEIICNIYKYSFKKKSLLKRLRTKYMKCFLIVAYIICIKYNYASEIIWYKNYNVIMSKATNIKLSEINRIEVYLLSTLDYRLEHLDDRSQLYQANPYTSCFSI